MMMMMTPFQLLWFSVIFILQYKLFHWIPALYTSVNSDPFACIYLCEFVHGCLHIGACICMCCVWGAHTRMYVCEVYPFVHLFACVCMCVCVCMWDVHDYVYLYVCLFRCLFMCVHLSVNTCLRAYICMCTCICVCACVRVCVTLYSFNHLEKNSFMPVV